MFPKFIQMDLYSRWGAYIRRDVVTGFYGILSVIVPVVAIIYKFTVDVCAVAICNKRCIL